MTIMLQLLWSGLHAQRCGQAGVRGVDRVMRVALILHMQKTGEPVCVPLPPNVVAMLRELPNPEEKSHCCLERYQRQRLHPAFVGRVPLRRHFSRQQETCTHILHMHARHLRRSKCCLAWCPLSIRSRNATRPQQRQESPRSTTLPMGESPGNGNSKPV